jgi:hypothetical protein
MLGKRKSQRSLFDVIGLPHRVAPDSFYGRMGNLGSQLFHDEDFKDCYSADTGRASLPPALMSGVLLLQFYDDVSDAEAVERVCFDLRWKVALNVSLDYAGFHPSSLSVFRARLLEHGKERYAFDRLLAVSREAGLLADKVTLLTDTTNVKGAGAVQDTYTLLRKGIRKLLKTMGYHLPGQRHGCSPDLERLLATYVDQDRRAPADWSDPAVRQAQLQRLVADSEATLDLALAQADDPDVRGLGWLIAKILGDDIDTADTGEHQIAEGTAPDRLLSLTDPAMRHGHKSVAHKFDGYKTATSIDQASELILDIADQPANAGDGKALLPTIARVEEHAQVTVDRVLGDGAYGSGENRAACAERPGHPIDLVSPMARPSDPAVDKAAFTLDLPAHTATCPNGQSVSASRIKMDETGRTTYRFSFARTQCLACPLFARCVRSATAGRILTVSPYEGYLRAARQRQQTDEFQALYRLRARVEGKQAELVAHGLRQTRYVGAAKRRLQRLFLGAAINLKRIFTLAAAKGSDLLALLSTPHEVRRPMAT